jgi:hypothetical protein
MRRHVCRAVIILACWLIGIAVVYASSVDQHIKNLKSDDPEVRAKAAYELGCT